MQQEITRVALDAMGGDNAPGELVKGAVDAVNGRSDIKVLLVGQQDVVEKELKQYSYPKEQIEVVHAEEVIETAEPPVNAIRKKKQSSIVVGMNMVKLKEADAFVSSGSSGAILVGGQVIVGRSKGVQRPPLAPLIPTETEAAWYSAVTSEHTPTALVLTRQNLEPMAGSSREALKGGYIIDDCEGTPELILIASGSEVALAVHAKETLAAEGQKVRVVSMPCMDLFEEQSEEYKESVLPREVRRRVAVEALGSFGWDKYTGLDGKIIAMERFGASAPAGLLFKKFGFTVEHVVEVAKSLK